MSNLFPYKKNTLRLKLHSTTLMISISLWLSAVMELAGVGLTFWLTWSSIGWLKVTINGFPFTLSCSRWSVALATLKPLIFHRGSWGCIRGWLFWGLERQRRQRQTWREWREWNKEKKREMENGKETCTHISNYLFKLPSWRIDLQHNCNMNLDSTCMEMKCLKGKYIENQNFQMLLQWFESIFNI